ncbi:MAG TPA: hypothetical protein VIB47_13965 [Dehalococcoidia bacterium]|jgi:hypothetical protein
MSVYIGFYRPNLEYRADAVARARRGEVGDPEIIRLIRELPGSMPQGCRILGAYTTMSQSHPNVLIVDAADTAGLAFISRYYRGYLEFDWTPCRVLGATEDEREQFLQGLASSA